MKLMIGGSLFMTSSRLINLYNPNSLRSLNISRPCITRLDNGKVMIDPNLLIGQPHDRLNWELRILFLYIDVRTSCPDRSTSIVKMANFQIFLAREVHFYISNTWERVWDYDPMHELIFSNRSPLIIKIAW